MFAYVAAVLLAVVEMAWKSKLHVLRACGAGSVLLLLSSLCLCKEEGERRETEGGRESVDRSSLH